MGTATTCEQARKLLVQQSQALVCAQINEGRCATSQGGRAPTGPGTCDRACASECNGSATCMKLCGC
jgi:hypothetical protein